MPSRNGQDVSGLGIRQSIDWRAYPTVVIESDDWGVCEGAPDMQTADAIASVQSRYAEKAIERTSATAEAPADLDAIYHLLEQYTGADGVHPVITAFCCTGNPDFETMICDDYCNYCDVGIDQGLPSAWQSRCGRLAEKWREGETRGVFWPEYHGNLHHVNPDELLAKLRTQQEDGARRRELFKLGCYRLPGEHIPEYQGWNIRRQDEWVRTGLHRFQKAVGRKATASVTSDALPITETIWALNGIKTVCLKNARINSGEVVVYDSKPWNNQNPYVKMGMYEPLNDLVYLCRNVFFECLSPEQTAAAVLPVIESRWDANEPAVLSMHRGNLISLNEQAAERGRNELRALLDLLTRRSRTVFLTTTELSDLYRQGWSLRQIGGRWLLRCRLGEAVRITLPFPVRHITAAASGSSGAGDIVVYDEPTGEIEISGGDYWITPGSAKTSTIEITTGV